MTNQGMPRLKSLTACVALALAGCSTVSPVPYTEDELKERVHQDQQVMYIDQEPIAAPIGFHEAAARALKYNLDYRLKLMESALSKSLHDVSTHEMLPRIVAGAGYSGRSNDSGGDSIGIVDRIESNRPTTSEERNRSLGNLTFSWNALDFGVSYYRAQQKADQVLMAQERRRKVIQNVLQDVRNSYWRALGAQRLLGKVDGLLARVNKALDQARQVEKQGLMPRAQVLAYQRALLDAVNLLTLRRQDLELAKAELAALMSVPAGTPFTLVDEPEMGLPQVPTDFEKLEGLALEKRPELMEEWYRKRVTENDIKAAKLLLWPNLSLDIGPRYDSNRFLYNNSWMSTGIQLSWNILKLTQWPALKKAHEDQNKTDDTRRMALSMAVLTQVRIGALRYGLAVSELEYANESLRVDLQLLNYSKAAAKAQFDSELEVIRAEARALLAEYQRMAAYSNVQAAWGRLYNSVGLDVMPEHIDNHDVKTVASSVQQAMQGWQKTTFGDAVLNLPPRLSVLDLPDLESTPSTPSAAAAPDTAPRMHKVAFQPRDAATATQQPNAPVVEALQNQLIQDQEMAFQVKDVIDRWAKAWAGRDRDGLAGFYSDRFVSQSGENRLKWLERRGNHMAKAEAIQVEVFNPQVTPNGPGKMVVTFEQRYSSGRYTDRVNKSLSLHQKEGQWLIYREESTSVLN
jgi:outer membrane protein TolC